MSRRAYAAARGVDEAAIRKAIKAGKIVPMADGRIDPDQADANWWRYSQANPATHARADSIDDDFIRHALAEGPQCHLEAVIRRLMDELAAPLPGDDELVVRLGKIEAAITLLRQELRTERRHVPVSPRFRRKSPA
jgi:hypothetical protein